MCVCVKMIYHRFNTHETPTRSKPLGSVPHLAYLSSLSLGGRAYSGLSWRIFSLSRFHPSGVPTVGHSRESNIIISQYLIVCACISCVYARAYARAYRAAGSNLSLAPACINGAVTDTYRTTCLAKCSTRLGASL